MNLYYAVTNYHLLCCILHAIKYHKDEENVLYLSCWHPDHEELLKRLSDNKFFSRVELFQEVVFPSGNKRVNNKQIELDIQEILTKIPKNFISDVNKSNEINIAGDHYSSSVYLVEKKIAYNYIEEACGVLSDEERLMKIIKNIDYSRYQVMKKLALPGNHKFIINRYGDLDRQLENYFNKKDVHFSVPEILATLSKKRIYEIVRVFSEHDFKLPNNASLFLTFHYVNMNLLKLDEQRLLYTLLIDYFCGDDNLVIKPHPSDVQPNYNEWFPEALVLPRQMPSELLPFLSDKKFSKALTPYSTSVFSLMNYCNNIISFSRFIEQTFISINKYYFVLKFLQENNLTKYKIYGLKMDETIIDNFCNYYGIGNLDINFIDNVNEIDKDKTSIIIIDKFNEDDYFREISGNNIIFWLNRDNLFDFISSNDFDFSCFSIVKLNKKILNENKYCNDFLVAPEFIYYYVPNEFDVFANCEFNFSKELFYSNVLISSDRFNVLDFLMMLDNLKTKNDNIEVLLKEKDNLNNILVEKDRKIERLNIELNSLRSENVIQLNKLNSQIQMYNDVVNSSSWKITGIYRKVGGLLKKKIGVGNFENKKDS